MKSTLILFKKLMPYVKKHQARIIGSLLFSFALAGIQFGQVYLVKPIFDSGLSKESSLMEALYFAGMLLFLGILNFPVRFFHFYWIRYVVDESTCSIRTDLFSKLQRLPTSYYTKNKQGNLLSVLMNDTTLFSQGLRNAVDLVREPLKALAMFVLAIYRDWQLTLVIVVVAPLFVMIFQKSGKKIRVNQIDVQKEMGELTHSLSEAVAAHKITKAFNLQRYVLDRFKKVQDRYFSTQMRTTYIEEIAHPLVEFVGAFAFAGVIVFAHYRIQSGEITTGDFISFIAALAMLMDPIRKYSQANVKMNQALAASDRIFEIFDYEEETDVGEVEAMSFNHKIEVKNLSFSYNGETNIISDLNLTIEKGKKIALVGLSGSGKSTLVNLLLGLYPVKRGTILIDGHDINDIKLESLRSMFGLVSQDIFLFHDSIKENILLSSPYCEESFNQSLEISYASEFIKNLDDGAETIIGDRGARLSGGQQQRITIARAFMRSPDIFLFDEATSALDNESEKVVQSALEKISKDKTVLAVAHRLSTIQHFDIIYVLKSGRVTEYGNHHALMAQAGEYAKLYELSKH